MNKNFLVLHDPDGIVLVRISDIVLVLPAGENDQGFESNIHLRDKEAFAEVLEQPGEIRRMLGIVKED